MKKFLSASQIAKYEEVTRETVTRWIRKGDFPGTRKVGKTYKIPIDSYHEWREGTKLEEVRDRRTSVRTVL